MEKGGGTKLLVSSFKYNTYFMGEQWIEEKKFYFYWDTLTFL